MSFKSLIFRNLIKNIKNYYLYVFALVFSVSLYFAFVILQYDPSMDAAEGTVKGEAALKTASVLLIAIVTVFLVYANNLFIKRRGKEIGLFQLVGITKKNIFWILGVENFTLYFGSMVVGIFLGFASSKLIMMILLNIIGINEMAELRFSTEALTQTVVVFVVIYFIISIINALFIKRQRILTLFHTTSTSEEKKHKVSILEIIIGILGLALIIFGYYLSSKLFDGNFTMMEQMFLVMLIILASVIIGTYFFYKGSVRFIFHVIRKKNNGYLSVNKVLSLSSIMFRMKSNSLLLTVVTTVSALAIGLLSLSYISYYSAEKSSKESVVYDFSIPNEEHANTFTALLEENGLEYERTEIALLQARTNLTNIVDFETDSGELSSNIDLNAPMDIVSDKDIDGIDVASDEAVFINTLETIEAFMSLNTGDILVQGKSASYDLELTKIEDRHEIPRRLTSGGFPVAVIDDSVYHQLKADVDPEIVHEFPLSIGINMKNEKDIEKANEIFTSSGISEWAAHESQMEDFNNQKRNMGLIMFVVGFLGLTFLITSGCILYFKQMDEGEQEKGSYTILRKLGFTKTDLINGIKIKQLFNFGIPLLVGLSHSYFAVKSGWFWFGTEMFTPMIIVMVLYTILYSIFGFLSVVFYRKLIKDAL